MTGWPDQPGTNRANTTNRLTGYPTGDGFSPLARPSTHGRQLMPRILSTRDLPPSNLPPSTQFPAFSHKYTAKVRPHGHKNMRIRTKPLRNLHRGAESKNKRVLDNRLFKCQTIAFLSR